MKKTLAILTDNNHARLVIENIDGYYVEDGNDKFRIVIFFNNRPEGRVSEEFHYNSLEELQKDAEFLDSFFEARDIILTKEQHRLDSLV
jgi:hypothetical protein